MIAFLKNIFGLEPETDLKALVKTGVQIIDVRTKSEFQTGHIPGAINIPLQNLRNSLLKIKKDKPIITCCASGIRSTSAKNILESNGFNQVFNGGGWDNLLSKIR